MPVVRSSSPPDSHGVGSMSSLMCTHRIGASAASLPVSSSSSVSSSSACSVNIRRSSLGDDPVPGLRERRPENRLDLVELLGVRDQRRGQLHDRVAAVVRAADQALPEELAREEAAQKLL